MVGNESIISGKSKDFALRIIKLYSYLCSNKKEYVLSKQILRSGTSIGANVKEATMAQSKPDFYAKLHISITYLHIIFVGHYNKCSLRYISHK